MVRDAAAITMPSRRRHAPADIAHWLRGWHDREGAWTSLRNPEHWMDRAGG